MSSSISTYIVEPHKDSIEWMGDWSYGLEEFVYGAIGETLKTYLSADDQETLQPVDWPENDADAYDVAKDPVRLKAVVQKIIVLLDIYSDELPLAHSIVEEEKEGKPLRMSSTAFWQDDSGKKWTVQAFHFSVGRREKVRVSIRNGDKEEYWIPAKEIINVGGRQFKIHTRTWFEMCKGDLETVLDLCERAIRMGLPILLALVN